VDGADEKEIMSAANIREDVHYVRVWETAGLKPIAERVVEGECQRQPDRLQNVRWAVHLRGAYWGH
jgi:hypothetical protein